MQVDIGLFGHSAVRKLILRRFFARPNSTGHVRELARELGCSPTIVSRELRRLEEAGVLTSEWIGRTRRYRVDDRSPIASEIRSLVQKTIGVEARLAEALAGIAEIEEAFVYGSYARGEERASSDLDLLVIGSVDQKLLSERVSDAERDLARDINVTSYERAELDRMQAEGDLFVKTMLDGPRKPLISPARPNP
jgi:predicted nucleotidyltransferase